MENVRFDILKELSHFLIDMIPGGYPSIEHLSWGGLPVFYYQFNKAVISFNLHTSNFSVSSSVSGDIVKTKSVYLREEDKIVITLAWLRNADNHWFYGYRQKALSDYDLRFYDPSGGYVSGRYGKTSNVERIETTATTTGYFEIKVKTYTSKTTEVMRDYASISYIH